MPEARRFGLMDFVLLLVVLLVAGGARAWYVATFAHGGTDDGPIQVQEEWGDRRDALVTNLRESQEFTGPAPLAARNPDTGKVGSEKTAFSAPLYPWLLSLILRISPDLDSMYRLARWGQCGLGALTAVLYFLFARRAFQSLLAAFLAGLFCALYPCWVVNTAERADGTVTSFLLALCLWLGVRGSQSGGALTSWFYGLGLAGLAMVRAALLPFAFVGVLWFLLRTRKLQRGWLYGLLAFLGFFNGLVPWTLRNYQTFGDVIPIVDSSFLHLWIGNNALATGGPQSEETVRTALATGEEPLSAMELERLGEKERYLKLAPAAMEQIRANPAATFQRRLWAGLFFVFGEDWFKTNTLWRGDLSAGDLDGIPQWLIASYPAAFYGAFLMLLVFGFLGWRLTFGIRQQTGPAALALAWIALPYVLSHAEALHGPRLPLDGILLSYGAFILISLFSRSGGADLRQDPAPAARREKWL